MHALVFAAIPSANAMTIWKTICSYLVQPCALPARLSIVVSGFLKIICNFFRLVHLPRGKTDAASMSPDEQLVKLCDPPTEETVEIPIEPTNSAGELQIGCEAEEPKAFSFTYHCMICDDNCDHTTETCPDRSGKFITVCTVCDHLPCKNEADHKEYHCERLFFCSLCNTIGDHLTKMCPDCDSDMGDEDWGSDTDDDNWDIKGDLPENIQRAATAA